MNLTNVNQICEHIFLISNNRSGHACKTNICRAVSFMFYVLHCSQNPLLWCLSNNFFSLKTCAVLWSIVKYCEVLWMAKLSISVDFVISRWSPIFLSSRNATQRHLFYFLGILLNLLSLRNAFLAVLNFKVQIHLLVLSKRLIERSH